MIISRLSGGMGNQMFQYAFGRALSLRNNVPLKLNIETFLDQSRRPMKKNFAIRTYVLGDFAIAAEIAQPNELPFLHRMYWKGKTMVILDAVRRRIFFPKGRERSYRYETRSILFGPDTYLIGLWQSPKYFAGYEDVIRADFSLNHPLSPEANNLVMDIKNSQSLCVHVRRTDFVNNSFHPVQDVAYYNAAMAKMAALEQIEKIYIFSDDKEWCQEHLSFNYPTTIIGPKEYGGNAAEHLYMMSQCKHFIIANSSFAWWAVWLSTNNNKTVIAPKKWFTSLDTSDLVPEEWIRL